MIIGISGYARSGKDEASKALEVLGFERVAFADKVREFLYLLNPIVGIASANRPLPVHPVRLQHVIDAHGWDSYKETEYGEDIRGLLQRLGTECGRGLISDTIWIDAALKDRNGNIAVPDTRFTNEAKAIRDRGGKVIRIERPGVGPANAHPSETSLDGFDFDDIILNVGTLKELHHKVRQSVTRLH